MVIEGRRVARLEKRYESTAGWTLHVLNCPMRVYVLGDVGVPGGVMKIDATMWTLHILSKWMEGGDSNLTLAFSCSRIK